MSNRWWPLRPGGYTVTELTQLSWAMPDWLWCLPLPWIMLLLVRRQPAAVDRVGDAVLAHPAPPQAPPAISRKRWWPWLQALGMSVLLVALARPQSLGDWLPQEPVGQRVVLVVDASSSMNIDDFVLDGQAISRLDVLKGVVTRFVRARHGSHFGIVVFAGNALTLLPITSDRELVTSMLARVQPGIADPGTAIGDALALALKQIREGDGPRPVVMLFTDGEGEAGKVRPREALTLARELKVPLYTVAVTGATDIAQTHAGHVPGIALTEQEPGLRDLAEQTGGHWYRAGDTAALEAVIRDVDRLEKTVTPPPVHRAVREWFVWPLWTGIALLVLAQTMRLWRGWSRKP